MLPGRRMKKLLECYIGAKEAGLVEQYDIHHASPNVKDITGKDYDDYEHYFILLQPRTGIYRDQCHILEMKTALPGSEDMYPIRAPKIKFLTKIYHTNVSLNGGTICLDIIKEQDKWSSTYTYNHIIDSLRLLLEDPNNASPMNGEAARLHTDCEQKYRMVNKRNMTVAEADVLRDECFSEFKQKADEIYRSNNVEQYVKLFPQIRNRDNTAHIHKDIATLKELLEQVAPKKKAAPVAAEQDEVKKEEPNNKDVKDVKPKINVSKFDKYRKK
jgi:ubiquitin-protein ligase